MRKVLFVAYYFPPLGGAGVQRSLKFARYLPAYGWAPLVLTTAMDTFGARDESLLAEIDQGLEVVRVKAFQVMDLWSVLKRVGLQKAASFVDQYLLVPDGQVLWQRRARRKALELLDREQIGVVYTTSGPYSSHLLGLYLKRKRPGIKWVADFRDEWTTHHSVPYFPLRYNRLRLALERRMEEAVSRAADRIVTVSEPMRRKLAALHSLRLERVTAITNGYDPADFPAAKPGKAAVFTVAYNGSFYGMQDPANFLQAVRELLDRGVLKEGCIRLIFSGNTGPLLEKAVLRYCLEQVVEVYGYLEHRASLALLASADALLLIVGNGPISASVYTGKIFEYGWLKKPILALVPPEGVAAEFIRETQSGLVADLDDQGAVQQALKELYERHHRGELESWPFKTEALEKYDRRRLAGDLAKVFNELAAEESRGGAGWTPSG